MNRKISITFAAALLLAPIFAGTASATEEVCVPSEARIERVLVTPAVEAVFEVKLHTWNGGPEEIPPAADSPDWNPTNGDPQGGPHAEAEVGVAYQTNDNGNGNWFIKLNVLVTPGVDAVYRDVEIPAVVCPEPTPMVPTPTPVITPPGGPNDKGEVCCAVSLPKPTTEVGDGGAERPAKDELPATGNDDAIYIALAGLGLIGLGYVAYRFGRRP